MQPVRQVPAQAVLQLPPPQASNSSGVGGAGQQADVSGHPRRRKACRAGGWLGSQRAPSTCLRWRAQASNHAVAGTRRQARIILSANGPEAVREGGEGSPWVWQIHRFKALRWAATRGSSSANQGR